MRAFPASACALWLSLCLLAQPAAAQDNLGARERQPVVAPGPARSPPPPRSATVGFDPGDVAPQQAAQSSDAPTSVVIVGAVDWQRLFPRLIEATSDHGDCGAAARAYLDLAWLRSCFGEAAVAGHGPDLQLTVSSPGELYAGIERANRVFFQQGYVNSGVRLVTAPVGATGLVLRVVDGRAGMLPEGGQFVPCRLSHDNSAGRGTAHRYVERRLMRDCDPDRPFNVYFLELDFRRLADDRERWIDRINARLEPVPGEERQGLATVNEAPSGEGAMIVRHPPVELRVGVANDRSPSIGSVRGFAAATLRGPTGSLIDAEVGTTEGALDTTATLYLALAPRWTAAFRGDINEAGVVDPILRPLRIRSRGWGGEVSLVFNPINCPLTPLFGSPTGRETRQAYSRNGVEICALGARLPGDAPLDWSPARDLSVAITLSHQVSRTYLLGEPFSFAPGSVDGRSYVTTLRGSLDWLVRGRAGAGGERGWTFAARLQLSQGLDGSATDIAGLAAPPRHFSLVAGQIGYAKELPVSRLVLTARVAAQWTRDLLYTALRFPVGGVNSVRGYPEAVLLADRGVAGSVELSRVVSLDPRSDAGTVAGRDLLRFRISAFADAAYAQILNPDARSRNGLASVGTGIAWIPSDAVELRVQYGLRLGDAFDRTDSSLARRGLHFRLTVDPLRLFRSNQRSGT